MGFSDRLSVVSYCNQQFNFKDIYYFTYFTERLSALILNVKQRQQDFMTFQIIVRTQKVTWSDVYRKYFEASAFVLVCNIVQ